MNHQGDEDWMDFFAMNDLGIPLAVLTVMGGAHATEQGEKWIGDTFDSFCEALGIEDTGFSTIDEMMLDAEG